MGSLFRSEEMTLCQLFLHTDSAYNCISELGELGAMQFIDTIPDTNAFQRKFVNEVRRCEEMERKLRYLEKEILMDSIPILNTNENPAAPEPKEIIDLEANFEALENDLKEINKNFEQLKKNFNELIELYYLLQKTKAFFDEGIDPLAVQADSENVEDRDTMGTSDSHIKFIAGVIVRSKISSFERIIWRACRGNVLLRFADIEGNLEDTTTPDNKAVPKSVFVVFFPGEQLKLRVQKICDAYHAVIYPCTDDPNERKEMLKGAMSRMDELKRVLEQTQSHRHNVLVTAAKKLRVWFIKVRKIKAIYHVLNLFNVNVTDKCMIGECWCPQNDIESIHAALRRGMERSNGTVHPILNKLGDNFRRLKPPTFNRVDKFTSGFQNIVDAYGVANYREVNPTPFTVITFPFLFAVMFGDMGHGFIMFLFALALVLKEKKFMREKSNNEIWNIFFGGRYIILLMGIFSVYTGFVYNDAFSKSLNIFGSSWYPKNYDSSYLATHKELQLNANLSSEYFTYPYAIGVDPAWQASKNKIMFTNSIKMKMSIILGVAQMSFGVCLSLMNHVFFKDYLSVFTEFIPQLIFLMAIFGYLVVEIFIKWISFSASTSKCAPQLLILLINMFMFRKYDPATDPCSLRPLFTNQFAVQIILVMLAILSVPWMLLVKPLVLYYRHKNATKQKGEGKEALLQNIATGSGYDNNAADINAERSLKSTFEVESSIKLEESIDKPVETEEEEEFNMGEIFVHQCIHTIEYCLGCISNTASYLRLWALSLAHGQLSEVLWTMVFKIGLGINSYVGCIAIFIVFSVWAALTVAVLLLMEGLSAFLHALRLHWVEFQNKFYKGEGIKFIPFTFAGVDDLTMEF